MCALSKKNEVNGALVLVTNDVSCLVTDCQLYVLVALAGELGHAALNGQSDGVFSELASLDNPPRVEVEELVSSTGITGGAEVDAWRALVMSVAFSGLGASSQP